QPEQIQQQTAETAVADRVREAQIHRQRHDVEAEWRADLQTLRQWRQRGAATVLAVPGIALHPCHHRHDLRQFDLVISGRQRLVVLAQCRLTVRAAQRPGDYGLIRVRNQRPTATLAAQTSLPRPLPFRLVFPVGLLGVRGWDAGVVRCLRRRTQLRLQFRHPRGQQLSLRPKRPDQRGLLVMRQRIEVGEFGHPKFESWPPWSRQWLFDSATRMTSSRWDEQIRDLSKPSTAETISVCSYLESFHSNKASIAE